MTKKEREKLDPIINAADNMADFMERVSADDEQFTSGGQVNMTAVKGMTSAIKELAAVIRNVNDIPTKAEKEAAHMAKEKFRMDREKFEKDDSPEDIRIIIQGAEDWGS